MAVRAIKPNIFSVGAIDWDRTVFDALVPLPHGTSYNAFLIRGSEKTALIDTVEPTKKEELQLNLHQSGIERLDYIIANHAEQDHSGAIPDVLEWYPEAKVVTNSKCKNFLQDLMDIPDEKFLVIQDKETLSLGDKTLQFYFTPWVHWPETMVTHLLEDRVLFSCDFFGSHVACGDLFVKDRNLVALEAKRYYAEIMMPFARTIRKHLQLVEGLEVEMIAPSHGPVYDDPRFIIDAYREWVSDRVKNEAIVLFVTMHGSTEKMARRLTDELLMRGVDVRLFNLLTADIGEIAAAVVDAATVVIASTAVLGGAHPGAIYLAYLMNQLKPKTRFLGVLGSFGWGNKLLEHLQNNLSAVKAEMLPPVLTKGYPREETWEQIRQLAETIAAKHQSVVDSAE